MKEKTAPLTVKDGMRLSLLSRRVNLGLKGVADILSEMGYTTEMSPNEIIPRELVYKVEQSVTEEMREAYRPKGLNFMDLRSSALSERIKFLLESDKKFEIIAIEIENSLKNVEESFLRKIDEEQKEIERIDEEQRELDEELRAKDEEQRKKEKELARREKELTKEEDRLRIEKKRAKILEEKTHLKISMHAASQLLINKEHAHFSKESVDRFISNTGLIKSEDIPTHYGVALNQRELKVFMGILSGFSKNNYTGDHEVDRGTLLLELFDNSTEARIELIEPKTETPTRGAPYQNIKSIPVIRLTQAQIITLSGYDLKKQGHKKEAIVAIRDLATKQYCFFWERLKKDSNGKPVTNKSGKYIHEEVTDVGTLLRIKEIKEKGILKYYEISPSAVMLDQVDAQAYGGNYFLLMPLNWISEVQKIQKKSVPTYTYNFLFFLRVQAEHQRRENANKKQKVKKDFTISKTYEDMAIAISIPESIYKGKKTRGKKILDDAYAIALNLGYLRKTEITEDNHKLYLNKEFYPKPTT
jgi:hypothetical protein